MSLSEIEFLVVLLFLLSVTLFCWFLWYKKTKRVRLIEDVPTSKIRSASQGYNEIIGHAEFIQNDVIKSPLSGRECVWYRYSVQEKKRDSRGNKHWETIEKKTSDDIFVLEDETSQCIVDPTGAEVISYEKKSWSGQTRNPGMVIDQSSSVFNTHTFRYKEEWIEPGEILYAIGEFETEGTGEDLPNLRDEIREVLKLWKANPKHYLKKFDKNKDGEIDVHEWKDVQQAAKQKVISDRMESAQLGVANIIRQPQDQPYILSSLNLDELVKHYRLGGGLSISIAIATGALIAFLIGIRF